MDPTAVREAMEASYTEKRSLRARLTDADLGRATANPKWRVRQLAGHIAEDDGTALYIGKLLARSKNARAPGFVVNLANWWSLRKYGKARAAELVPVLEQRHTALMTWFDALPVGALAAEGTVSEMGQLSLGDFLVRNCDHSRAHAADVRAALGE